MKRYIVTGGAGFIGAHLTSRLVREGHHVTVIDNLSTSRIENITPGTDFIQGDVSNPEDIEKLPHEGVEGIFHLAAQSSGEKSFEDPHVDFQSNVGGTLLLLAWCLKHKVRRFIFTSTMGVYGRSSEHPFPETTECLPKSFYGIGKLSAENYVNLYGGLGLDITILRPFNVYGPGQNMENMKQGMASIYMSFVLTDKPITVKGSLDRFRDQTYVDDIINAMILCLEKPVSIGQTYNIATGSRTTVRRLIEGILKAGGKPDDYPVVTAEGTPGDTFGCYADITKAQRELGWTSKFSLDTGLSKMYEFHKRDNSEQE